MKCNKESQKVNEAVGADEHSVEVRKVGRWCYQQRQTRQKHRASDWRPELHSSRAEIQHQLTQQCIGIFYQNTMQVVFISSSSSTNFIATQVLKQNFRATMCHVLHYSCNVNAAVADSLHCYMICETVPFSVHAWMSPATAATWSPAAAHSKSLPRQRGRRDRRWSCATTVVLWLQYTLFMHSIKQKA